MKHLAIVLLGVIVLSGCMFMPPPGTNVNMTNQHTTSYFVADVSIDGGDPVRMMEQALDRNKTAWFRIEGADTVPVVVEFRITSSGVSRTWTFAFDNLADVPWDYYYKYDSINGGMNIFW